MKSTRIVKNMTLTAVVLLASVSLALAHGGYGPGKGGGYGQHMMGPGMVGGGMMGGHMMGGGIMGGHQGGYMHGGGYGFGDLSKADWSKLQGMHDKFFQTTQDLRTQIAEQRLAIQREMIKKSPNSERLTDIQKTLSQLQADFDQKALTHHLAVRKLLPETRLGNFIGGFPGTCR